MRPLSVVAQTQENSFGGFPRRRMETLALGHFWTLTDPIDLQRFTH